MLLKTTSIRAHTQSRERLARHISLLRARITRAQLLNTQLRQPLAHIDRLLQALALHDTSDETASKGVARPVGVVDLVLADSVDIDLGEFGVVAADSDGGESTLCDDDCACALAVLLGSLGDVLCDLLDVLGLDAMRLCERSGLGLVADQDVDVWEYFVQRLLEELRDEGADKLSMKVLFFAAASSASALIAGTHTVKWKPPT